jgi:hypothetical protein
MLDVSPLLDDTDSNIPAVSRETSKTESEFDSESASSRSNKTESDEDFDDMVKNMEEQLYDGGDEND